VTNNLRAITCGSNLWAAVGEGGLLLASVDTTDWIAPASPTTASLLSVGFEAGQFVAVGAGGTIVESPDGTNWAQRISNTTQSLRDVCYGLGQWLVLGDGGTVATSTNGTNWSKNTVASLGNANTVVFSEGRFFAGCNFGRYARIATSTNGTDWQVLPDNSLYTYATKGNGQLLVGGGTGVFTSTDGTMWELRGIGGTSSMMAMEFGQNRFVAVGVAGQIYQSDLIGPRLTIAVGDGGRPALQIHGHAGADYEIQVSTNSSTWSPIAAGVQAADLLEWKDGGAATQRLFRVLYK